MTQTYGSGPRRPPRKLTPEQRRRLLRARRRKRRQRQLMIAVPVAVALIAVVAVGLHFALGGRGGGETDAPENVAASVSLTLEQPDDPQEESGGEVDAADAGATQGELPGSDAGATQGELPIADAQDAAQISAGEAVAPVAEPAANSGQTVPGGSFSFETAYVSALHQQATGPEVTANLSDVDPAKASRWPAAKEGYIPTIYNAENVDEKIIAVTVDDCFQAENLQQIVQCALDNGAKLTIFPIGRNLEKKNIANVVKWAWESGMEIENHTYSHSGTYHYADEKMTKDIWYQSYLLNQALGVNYEQHFYRPKGGDERSDQRAHAYASQLGMRGIAIWTLDGSNSSVNKLLNSLKPGSILLYHTTNKDLSNLLQFIPAAVQQGYRLVTLNDMFGLPDNRTSDLSTALQQAPALEAFQVKPLILKKTSYMRAAAVVQRRLIELGWMKGKPTGVYGDSTRASMMLFQAASGLSVDGVAGAESQQLLFSDGAEAATDQRIQELSANLDDKAKEALKEMFE